jgi:glycosyltransferase involved in cell wall biosynthesis
MKHILFISVNDHVPWGGSEELWSKTARHINASHNVSVLVKRWHPEPKPIEKLKAQGVKVYYKYVQKKQSLKNRLLHKVFKVPYQKTHHLDQDDIEKTDLVVITLGNHLDFQLYYYTDYLQEHNIPYVLVLQLVTDLRGILDSDINKFRESYLKAIKLYFLSKDNIDKAEMLFSEDFKNKELINNPFKFNAIYLPLQIKESTTYYLGCVAALNSLHKGLDVFLKVLSSKKWKDRPLNINLYGNGPNKEQIIRLIDLFGLNEKVSLVGYVSNKTDIWKHNIGLILPSRMEGQSLAMLEAMSYGRMVISTKVGDAERLVKHNETGFLIDAPTLELIDEALEQAWGRREDWIEMGKLSRIHLYETIKKDPIEDFSNKLLALLV